MKYFLLFFLMISNLFGMIDLSEEQANQALQILKSQKAVLIFSNDNFKYTKIISTSKNEGRVSKSNLFDIIHEDMEDYHIKINGQNIDLSVVYIRESSQSHKWIRLGNKIDPELFEHKLNGVVYVYKETEKPSEKHFKRIAYVNKVNSPTSRGRMTLTEEKEDAEFNHSGVYVPLKKTKLF